ncbi:MAG: hypothetical protein ACKVP7_04825 [Hyphomicrobiaceae bacterium]
MPLFLALLLLPLVLGALFRGAMFRPHVLATLMLSPILAFAVLFGTYSCGKGSSWLCGSPIVTWVCLWCSYWGLAALHLARGAGRIRAIVGFWIWGLIFGVVLLITPEMRFRGNWRTVLHIYMAASFGLVFGSAALCCLLRPIKNPEVLALLAAAPILLYVVVPGVLLGRYVAWQYYGGLVFGFLVYLIPYVLILLEQRSSPEADA